LNQEIPATVAGAGRRALVTIPQGSLISIIGPVAEEPEMVDILWDGQTARMFTSDLTARTTAITMKNPKATVALGGTIPTPPNSEGNATMADDAPKVRRFTASGRELL
jgi:hypothetical protein